MENRILIIFLMFLIGSFSSSHIAFAKDPNDEIPLSLIYEIQKGEYFFIEDEAVDYSDGVTYVLDGAIELNKTPVRNSEVFVDLLFETGDVIEVGCAQFKSETEYSILADRVTFSFPGRAIIGVYSNDIPEESIESVRLRLIPLTDEVTAELTIHALAPNSGDEKRYVVSKNNPFGLVNQNSYVGQISGPKNSLHTGINVRNSNNSSNEENRAALDFEVIPIAYDKNGRIVSFNDSEYSWDEEGNMLSSFGSYGGFGSMTKADWAEYKFNKPEAQSALNYLSAVVNRRAFPLHLTAEEAKEVLSDMVTGYRDHIMARLGKITQAQLFQMCGPLWSRPDSILEVAIPSIKSEIPCPWAGNYLPIEGLDESVFMAQICHPITNMPICDNGYYGNDSHVGKSVIANEWLDFGNLNQTSLNINPSANKGYTKALWLTHNQIRGYENFIFDGTEDLTGKVFGGVYLNSKPSLAECGITAKQLIDAQAPIMNWSDFELTGSENFSYLASANASFTFEMGSGLTIQQILQIPAFREIRIDKADLLTAEELQVLHNTYPNYILGYSYYKSEGNTGSGKTSTDGPRPDWEAEGYELTGVWLRITNSSS